MDSNVSISSSNTGRRLILIVDQDQKSQVFLRSGLEAHYEITTAGNGAEALQIIYEKKASLCLILMNLLLPDCSGMDILRRMRDDPLFMHIPVIVLSPDRKDEVESLNLGAMDFIEIPDLLPDALLARVHRAVELSENRSIIRSTERDQLTGLYNRDFFYRYAVQLDAHHAEWPTDAILMNINHFHTINDRYGKRYGDDLRI